MREITTVKKVKLKKIYQFKDNKEFFEGKWLKNINVSNDNKLEISYNPDNLVIVINELNELDVKKINREGEKHE